MLDALSHTSLMTAFLAGLLSFISPCVLPLVPSYVSYITGLSFEDLRRPAAREGLRVTIIANTMLFILGFSIVFVAFGASASALGQLLTDYQGVIRKSGAVLMIVFGLVLMGMLALPPLMREKRFHFSRRPVGYLGSLLVGATFAAGWTPCVGPVLGTMLLYASTADTLVDGVTLLTFYSLGIGVPLLVVALALDRFLASFRVVRNYLGIVSTISGLLLVGFGVVMYADRLTMLTSLFERYGIGSYLGQAGE